MNNYYSDPDGDTIEYSIASITPIDSAGGSTTVGELFGLTGTDSNLLTIANAHNNNAAAGKYEVAIGIADFVNANAPADDIKYTFEILENPAPTVTASAEVTTFNYHPWSITWDFENLPASESVTPTLEWKLEAGGTYASTASIPSGMFA